MSFGSFLQGIVAQINPFDNGATYGTYNPPKKKLQRGDPGYTPPTPQPTQQQQPQNTPQPQNPTNLFAGLHNDLSLPGSPQNNTTVQSNNTVNPIQAAKDQQQRQQLGIPSYVTTLYHDNNGNITGYQDPHKMQDVQIAPSTPQAPPPTNQPPSTSLLGHVGNFFKTAGQTGEALVSAVPAVGLAAGRAATGIVKGVAQIPHIATSAIATGTQDLNKVTPSALQPFTGALNTVAQGLNTGVKAATNVVDKPFNAIGHGLDVAAQKYNQIAPEPENIGINDQVYKETQVPLNILAGLLTLGTGTAGEATGAAGEAGDAANGGNLITRIGQFLNKPLTSNTDNVIAKTGQAVQNRATPVVQALNSPISSTARGIGNIVNGRTVPILNRAAAEGVDAGEAGNVLSEAQLNELTQPPTQIQVSQPQPIGVTAPPSEPVGIPVTNNTPTGQPIIEVGGDKPGVVRVPTANEVAAQRAANNFANQPKANPDQSVSGINTNPAQIVTQADKEQAQQVLDSYKATGKITDEQHQQLTNELNKIPAQDAPVPKGQPIAVKTVDSVPVQSQSTIPVDVKTTPGEPVPVTQTAPEQAATKTAAKAPTVVPPTELPKEVQNVLDNPKQFTKRQVAAARNQRTLARQMAKTKQQTAEAVDQLTSVKPASDKGFVESGEFRKGVNGNVSEVAHKDLEAAQAAHDTTNLSHTDVLKQAQEEVNQNGLHSPATVRNLKALRDSGQFAKNSPEYKAINDEYQTAISNHARALSMTDRAARANATGDQLANRFTSKLLTHVEDTSKVKDSDIAEVTQAENNFTKARDEANAIGEQFKAGGGQRAFNAWKAAQKAAEDADRQAKITEYQVAKRVLSGNKSLDAIKAVQDAEKKAGVYSMDSIDANMLSGTGTMVRNYVNTLFPRVENKLFGRVSSLAVRKLAPIGGSSSKGAKIGSQIGKDVFKADIAARKEAGVGFIRRTVTAGNQLGERNIEATTYAKAFDHYKQLLKAEGYSGRELNNRAEFNVRTDPDGLVKQYERDTLQANALSSMTSSAGGKKIENMLSDFVQRKLADAGIGHTGQVVGRTAAKATTRIGLGFPTVIARSLVEGLKRATLGLPEAGWSTLKYMKGGNADQYAGDLAKAIQHAGSGGALILLGSALGKMGVISGTYPTDKATQAQWVAEGKQDNSIKIGGQWFQIPGYLGGFGLPLMLGASLGTDDIKNQASLGNAWNTILSASPVDNIQSTLKILTGGATAAQDKSTVTSAIRSLTPAGSFVAELAKLTDPTQNDTTTKSAIRNIIDNVAAGIPGVNNVVNTIPKLDSYGNVLHNPNPVAQILGAQGVEQGSGTADVNKAQDVVNQDLQQLQQYGVFSNKNLLQLVDPKIAKQIQEGQPLSPKDFAKVQAEVTKGISPTTDSNWRENSDYATDKAALQTKLQMLEADPTAKPSEKQAYETEIKRDNVLAANNIPYEDLKLYKSTTVTQWRDMGDPNNANYDPTTYQALWNIDKNLAAGGGSYNTLDPSKQKFSAKTPSTSGSAASKGMSADFGKLTAASPKVQQYQTISTSSGNIPVIQAVQPNIVHKITLSNPTP
jgi:hypothetical protein